MRGQLWTESLPERPRTGTLKRAAGRKFHFRHILLRRR